jgi:hypothetical protein
VEFKAFLSAKKTASDKPLFDNKKFEQNIISAKSKWASGRYRWVDVDSREVAVEEGKGEQHRLVVTVPMPREMRDVLVALWVLRLWYYTAESRQARRKGKLSRVLLNSFGRLVNFCTALERLTPPSAYGGVELKFAKRTGALGAISGGGA